MNMSRDQLVAEARIAMRAARHNLKLLRRNPEKILPGQRQHVEGQLLQLIEFAKWEKKNARRAGRTSLRNRFMAIAVSILPYFRGSVNPPNMKERV